MVRSTARRATWGLLAILIAFSPAMARAALINIHLTDMDVSFGDSVQGGSLFDFMGGISGGSFNEATADDITSADFELDSTIVGSLNNTGVDGDDLHVDLKLSNIGSVFKNVYLPVVGNNGFTFGLDFFTDTGYYLKLTTDETSLLISNTTFLFSGEAQFVSQNLPFGLAIDPNQPIQFSFIANFPSVPMGPNITTQILQAAASGVLTISGTQLVPEPQTYVLLSTGLALTGLVCFRLQRRRRQPVPVVVRSRWN